RSTHFILEERDRDREPRIIDLRLAAVEIDHAPVVSQDAPLELTPNEPEVRDRKLCLRALSERAGQETIGGGETSRFDTDSQGNPAWPGLVPVVVGAAGSDPDSRKDEEQREEGTARPRSHHGQSMTAGAASHKPQPARSASLRRRPIVAV